MTWKWTLLIVLMPALAWPQAHEILRPTVDINGGSSLSNVMDLSDCSSATYTNSSAQPNFYDSGGLSTSSNFDLTNSSPTSTRCSGRVFKTWQASSQSGYTSLTLNINTSGSPGFGPGGTGTISYTTNGGATWSQVRQQSSAWSQTTDSITLSPTQDLTRLQVAVNDFATFFQTNGFFAAEFDITGFDVWSDGVYTVTVPPNPGPPPPAAVAHPVIISKLGWLVPLACGAYFVFGLLVSLRQRP